MEQKKIIFENTKSLNQDEINLVTRIKQRAYLDSDEEIMSWIRQFKLFRQEQSEVERSREEIKQWKERQIFLEDQHLEDLDKIQELESKLSQLPKD